MAADKLGAVFADLNKASKRLKEAAGLPYSQIHQDATIQRFEFTFELTWKLMQTLLAENGIAAYGPRNAIREAAKLGLIEDPQRWFAFLGARNMIAHTYNEKLAKEVYTQAKAFIPDLDDFLQKARDHLS